MVFSEAIFLFAFVPIAIVLISLARGWLHSMLILLFSLFFYFWSSGFLVALLAGSVVFNWAIAFPIAKKTRAVLPVAIIVNLLALLYFKYAFFVTAQFDSAFGTELSWTFRNVLLPVGISFFTFQGISYLVDVHRGDVEPERSPIVFGAYLTFFPQLIAGPIVRFRDAIRDYHNPVRSMENASAGASRFALGLFKKVVVADTAGRIADICFAIDAADQTFTTAWIGALAYSVQIYFDFSAYSDMAIGLGLIFGIRFNENFNRPYVASTITEFWRRWHVSLSTWFRDYLYIPLGGNRGGSLATYRNLMIVFLVTGFWHGAAWTFVIWGIYHGVFLILERIAFNGRAAAVRSLPLRFVYALPVVIFGWVLFRAETLPLAASMMAAMVQPWAVQPLPEVLTQALDPMTLALLAIGLTAFVMPYSNSFGSRLAVTVPSVSSASFKGPDVSAVAAPTPRLQLIRLGLVSVVLLTANIWVLSADFSPFLYFRF